MEGDSVVVARRSVRRAMNTGAVGPVQTGIVVRGVRGRVDVRV